MFLFCNFMVKMINLEKIYSSFLHAWRNCFLLKLESNNKKHIYFDTLLFIEVCDICNCILLKEKSLKHKKKSGFFFKLSFSLWLFFGLWRSKKAKKKKPEPIWNPAAQYRRKGLYACRIFSKERWILISDKRIFKYYI